MHVKGLQREKVHAKVSHCLPQNTLLLHCLNVWFGVEPLHPNLGASLYNKCYITIYLYIYYPIYTFQSVSRPTVATAVVALF